MPNKDILKLQKGKNYNLIFFSEEEKPIRFLEFRSLSDNQKFVIQEYFDAEKNDHFSSKIDKIKVLDPKNNSSFYIIGDLLNLSSLSKKVKSKLLKRVSELDLEKRIVYKNIKEYIQNAVFEEDKKFLNNLNSEIEYKERGASFKIYLNNFIRKSDCEVSFKFKAISQSLFLIKLLR